MLKPSIDTLLDKVPSKYSLVILEAKRAHELESGAVPTQEFHSVKSTLQALESEDVDLAAVFNGIDGIVVPGGFGGRGVEKRTPNGHK